MKNIIPVVMVILGTLIGAGFASGQEIYTFFYKNGNIGIIGILISTVLMSYIIYKTLIIIKEYKIENYKEFLENILNNKYPKLIEIINKVIEILILITFFVMVAGFGAYFEQECGINSMIGSGILVILCFVVFLNKGEGFIKINKLIVPILIIFIVVIGILNIPNIINNYENGEILTKNYISMSIKAIMYASYNIILLIPVLITLNKKLKDYKDIKLISIISGINILILSVIIFSLLYNIKINIEDIEMPVVYAISNYFIEFKTIYALIILTSIFTTSISLGSSYLKSKKKYQQSVVIMCITSWLFSKIGFSNLINLLYPIFGILGIVQIYIILNKKVN